MQAGGFDVSGMYFSWSEIIRHVHKIHGLYIHNLEALQ